MTTERLGAIETGGTWCVVGTGTAHGTVTELERFPTGEPEATIDRCAAWLRERAPLSAVGVAAFGPIELDRDAADWGVIGHTTKRAWRGTALAPRLSHALGTPIALDTDVNAAALAEHRFGAGAGGKSLAYITVGTGVGAGFVVDGHIVHGSRHPELGHMRLRHHSDAGSFVGICPFHGDCLEGLASGPALAARWGRPAEALADDHPAWNVQADHLAEVIITMTYALSLDRVVLGGGVGRRAVLHELVRERLTRMRDGYVSPPALLMPGVPDGRSGLVGGLALATELRDGATG